MAEYWVKEALIRNQEDPIIFLRTEEIISNSNIYPAGIAQNGFALITTGNRMLKNIDQFMILRLQVDDQSVGPHSTYRIGTISDGNNYCASIDVSEILAFNTVLSPENAMRIEGYLAHKWGLGSKLATDHPYAKALGYAIDTGVDMDLMVGSDGDTNHFGGIIDELRIYDRGLSSDEIMSIALDGTVRFTTSQFLNLQQLKFWRLHRIIMELLLLRAF